MKQLKIMPLVAVISGLMVGCGGGGGGGGSTPKTVFNFTFVVPQIQNLNDNGLCTIFERYNDANDVQKVLNYHTIGGVLDAELTAYYSDASGNLVGDIMSASKDKLSIILQSIPDGGSVTLQERNNDIVNAVTFSKELLEQNASLRNTYLSVESKVSGTTCLTGNNDTPVDKRNLDFLVAENAQGNPYSTFYFESQLETLEKNTSRFNNSDVLAAFSSEKVMIAQYRTDERSALYQYGFEGWPENRMVFTDVTSQPEINSNGIKFSAIDMSVIYRGFKYPLASIQAEKAFYHPDNRNGEVWTYSVEGAINTPGWKAIYSDKVSDDWNVSIDEAQLFAVNNITNNEPDVSNRVINLNKSIALGNESGLQRINYKQGAEVDSLAYKVNHTLYSLIDGKITVPKLNLSFFSTDVANKLVISNQAAISQGYLFTETQNAVQAADFARNFSKSENSPIGKDAVGVVMNLRQARDADNRLAQTQALFLERAK
ncbi:hypothetical protein [Vibrio sagamiensis]|uniref:Flagellar sheath protein A n=1 Tax=Vibrio sagamiensis NBRC 104589 TaxID=1219064 RepID=A0A511QC66_9VIBR|nr:hypothetical protein [Vibrio sagamiensis]GEM74891.1 flagellar sheath protein A [Vibrio sagamiensis NBRC 104589]